MIDTSNLPPRLASIALLIERCGSFGASRNELYGTGMVASAGSRASGFQGYFGGIFEVG